MSNNEKEPILGVSRIRVMKNQDSKLKAFCDVIVPTPFGGMHIRNFKIVDGRDGLFVSIPSRPSKVKSKTVDIESGQETVNNSDDVKYYNDIRFESKDDFVKFRTELNETVLRAVKAKLERTAPEKVEV